jgi:hypothetical protein
MRIVASASIFAGFIALIAVGAADRVAAQQLKQTAAGRGAVQRPQRTPMSSLVLQRFSSRAVFSAIPAADRGGFAPHHRVVG